ncbi:uncharacterized protein LOC142349035 isoform X2 [Convolutriloba macropyga]|uniref:uncharacterized protein LOC142349035 isoform X2 n=1 Tax=Convolutriloba macropyga TaxID=536237 RepID=UPI003F527309
MTIEESAWEDEHSCVLTLRIKYPPKTPKIKISPPAEKMTNYDEEEQHDHYDVHHNSESESDCSSSPLYYGVPDSNAFNGGHLGERFLEIKRSASACTTANNRLHKVTTTTNSNTSNNISEPRFKGRVMNENAKQPAPPNGVNFTKSEVNKTHTSVMADLESKLGSRGQSPNQLKIPSFPSEDQEQDEQDLLRPKSAPPGPTSNLHQSHSFSEKPTTKNKKNKTDKSKKSDSENKKQSGTWSWKRPWSIFVKPTTSEEKQAKRSQSFSANVLRKTNASKLPQQQLYKLEHDCSFKLSTDIAALRQEFSYRSITREDANTLLSEYEFGTYLLRPNSTCTDFCLSYVVSPTRIEHTHITREHLNGEEKFILSGKSTKRYNSLLEIVDMGRTKGFDIMSDSGSRMTFFLLSPPSNTALRDKSAADHLMILQ